jgi:signal transduction histidine kinase
MSYKLLQWFTVLLPPSLIGGFEYIRHSLLLPYMSMETGNFYITLLSFILSFLYASWMFRTIRRINERLAEEQARRAVYEERERLARELHDGIAQTLFYLNVKLQQGKIEEARKAVSEIDNHVRHAIFNLRSRPEKGESFSLRLKRLLTQWSDVTGLEVSQEILLPEDYFSPAEEVHVFAIVQEALANIRKHANAQHVEIQLRGIRNGGWQLRIADDGRGLDLHDLETNKYGLSIMRERAAQLDATFEIRNRVTGGTELVLTAGKGDSVHEVISRSRG